MIARHHDYAVPAIARQQRQVIEQVLGTGIDGAVDAVLRHHFRDLLGCALMQVQAHVGVAGAELLNHLRQHVARLGMGRPDSQAPAPLIAPTRSPGRGSPGSP